MKMRRPILILFGLLFCFRGLPAPAVETTIYVGKHFEVRDHDQPTKYVFNGSTRVAHIIGSLSTNTRIQRFRLHPGWNLLSLAVSATNLFDQLQRPNLITSVYSWNPQTGTYLALAPGAVAAEAVLWIHATTNATIGVTGTYSDPINRAFDAGATYLAGPGLEAWTHTLPPTLAVWHFSLQPSAFSLSNWRSRLTGDLSSLNDLPFTFPPGQALYVVNSAPSELAAPDPALRVRYYHQDHLGSSSVMTDANGALIEETAFYPFGIPRHEHRLRQIEESYKFTQKERDQEGGLHYFEARYLTGGFGRFMTQDPMYTNPDALSSADAAAFLTTPQRMNTYSYARNNPLNYIDPTGLQDEEEWEGGYFDYYKQQGTAKTGSSGISGVGSAHAEGGTGGGFSDTIVKMGRQGVSFVVGASDKLAWGMGASYQVVRPIVVEGYDVDTDSAGYTAGGYFGDAVNVGATLFLPGPKGPAPAPGTVTLFAKAPAPVAGVLGGAPAPVPGQSGAATTSISGPRYARPLTLPGTTPFVQPAGRTREQWFNLSTQAAGGTRTALEGQGRRATEVVNPIMQMMRALFGGF